MGIISNNSIVLKQNKNFKSLKKTVLLSDAVNNNDKKVIKSQQIQMFEGKDSQNKKIKPKYRNKAYSSFKNQENPLPGSGTPDLKLSGDMYNAMFVEVSGSNYIVGSAVDYFRELQNKYSSAFGLSKKSAQNTPEVNNDYLKSIHKEINK